VLADVREPFLHDAHELEADVARKLDVAQIREEFGRLTGIASEALHHVGQVVQQLGRVELIRAHLLHEVAQIQHLLAQQPLDAREIDGRGPILDAVLTSAEAGARKPDPQIFRMALERTRVPAERAILVGDSLDVDVAGGQAAGIRSLLLDRNASAAEAGDVERISTLDNLPTLVAGSPIV